MNRSRNKRGKYSKCSKYGKRSKRNTKKRGGNHLITKIKRYLSRNNEPYLEHVPRYLQTDDSLIKEVTKLKKETKKLEKQAKKLRKVYTNSVDSFDVREYDGLNDF
jgi:hypothetical protein